MNVFPARLELNCGCGICPHLGQMAPPLWSVHHDEGAGEVRRVPKAGTNQKGSFSHVPVVFRGRTLSEARPADGRGDSQFIRCGPPAADLSRTKSRSMALHLAKGLSAWRHARPSSAKARKERVGVQDGAYLTTDHEQKGGGYLIEARLQAVVPCAPFKGPCMCLALLPM